MTENILRVAFHNLGCKVNGYETEAMIRVLTESGRYRLVPFEEEADVVVINTCSVTNIADRKSRQMLHRARARSPHALIVGVGCYVQAAGEKLLEDEAVDLLIGNDMKSRLPELLEEALAGGERRAYVQDMTAGRCFEEFPAESSDHTRAFLKIEDGCNQFCTYCLIPYLRGRVRSRSEEEILREARLLIAKGYGEIVLTGIHISSYGLDQPGDSGRGTQYGAPLLELCRKIDALPGIGRLRLGSLEPRIITREFAEGLKALPSFCPHFHLSLQSGSDATLKRMNRRYSAEQFRDSVRILREVFDEPALTTDVIVGFAGETEDEFAETVAFLEDIRFYETHIFRYSRRRGTVADRMPDQVPEPVKAERSRVLQELNARNKAAYEQAHVGKVCRFLPEECVERDGRCWALGHTREYLMLCLPWTADMAIGKECAVVPDADSFCEGPAE